MEFSKESIQQGRANQDASVETPETFATIEGASQPREGTELSKGNSRMAGEMGARALELMNNPNEQVRVQNWMSRFGMTNQGMEWNQAKMGIPPQ
tara:strand:+ start:600 stop:884 length:285 start_codon:yes stop_codon:yes gene_type:complete